MLCFEIAILILNLQDRLYIVMDTSAFLTHLDMVIEYKDNPIRGVGQPVFICPWTVLQELDRLYEHSDEKISDPVQKVVLFLENSIRNKHPRIIFQSYEEVLVLIWLPFCVTCVQCINRCCT